MLASSTVATSQSGADGTASDIDTGQRIEDLREDLLEEGCALPLRRSIRRTTAPLLDGALPLRC